MDLIHKEPVRWTHDRIVACEGGDGPAGHPRVFINTDKPEIAICGYCGLPFVSRLTSACSETCVRMLTYSRLMSTIESTSNLSPRHHTLSHEKDNGGER